MSYEIYFKDVSGYDVIDVYRTHRIFGLNDEVLCHASKKLLLSGVRTGGKTLYRDVREARDSLNRWLEMLAEDLGNAQEEDGWTPEAINEAAFKDAHKEYTLQEALGTAVLRADTRWVAVDANGDVREFLFEPTTRLKCNGRWQARSTFDYLINKVVPPLNFKNCIWRVNVKPDCEYTLDSVVGESDLSDWARWVAVDSNGYVYEYYDRPHICNHAGQWNTSGGDWNYIGEITPPTDFTKCIWEVKN